MRNLFASLIAASILGASSLAAADEPAPPTAPVVSSPVVAPVTPAIAALPVIAPPVTAAPLGRAEQALAIPAEPRIRSRALVGGGIGATAGGIAFLTFGIWAVSRPVSPPCTPVSKNDPLAATLAGGLEAMCTVGAGAGDALRAGGIAATILGGIGTVAGVTMMVVGAGPARASAEHARLPAPTLSVGPRSAALRWTF